MARTILLALVLALACAPAARAGDGWHVLEEPIHPRHQTSLGFGAASHWMQPWRAYLDTVPGTRLRSALGAAFNVPPAESPATAAALAEAGFRRARIEIPWSDLRFDDPSQFRTPALLDDRLRALKTHGLRPLILLNANHGAPGPTQEWSVRLTAPAQRGTRSIQVDAASADAIVPRRSGLDRPDGKAADVLFTDVAPDGTVQLSKPLERDLASGEHSASTLRYEPFAYPFKSRGVRNLAFERTLAGWLQYVDTVTRAASRVFGRDGFDVEIWNELTFGSDFLEIRQYYAPVPEGLDGDDRLFAWAELLDRTVAWLREPGRGFERVGISNGFASQTPWPTAANSAPGQTAISKHPYHGPVTYPQEREFRRHAPVDARGELAGTLDRQTETWRPSFVPSYRAFFPEYWLNALQTEHLVRDLSPITTDIYGTEHGRAARAPHVGPQQVWLTETGLDPVEGERPGKPRTAAERRRLLTKSTLRSLVAWVSKGASLVSFYAARDSRLGLISEDFFAAAKQPGDRPSLETAGETLVAMRRLMAPFRKSRKLDRVRPLSLLEIADRHNHTQFAGDGTAAHPPLYNRDVVAFLPFQVSARRWVVAAYVMTRDIAEPLPAERYRIVVGGLPRRVRVRALDPLTGARVSVRTDARPGGAKALHLGLTDTPRLLVIDEASGRHPGATVTR